MKAPKPRPNRRLIKAKNQRLFRNGRRKTAAARTTMKGKKIYQSVLLRESYREGSKVRKRTVANLSHCTPEEIAAIKIALQHKSDLSQLGSLEQSVDLEEGLSMGAVWAVHQIAKRMGIAKALGREGSESHLKY